MAFEREKYGAEVNAKQDRKRAEEKAEASRQTKVLGCQIRSDESYWGYVKLNGQEKPGKKDAWTAPESVWNLARQRKQHHTFPFTALRMRTRHPHLMVYHRGGFPVDDAFTIM